MAAYSDAFDMPVVRDLKNFDRNSGNRLERLIFNNRAVILIACALISAFLGWHATRLKVNASFDKMIPQSHPFIRNYFDNKAALRPLGNSVRIVIENTKGDIFDPAFLEVVRNVNDTMFLTTGVDREYVDSIWSPYATWVENTEQGFKGGRVLPDDYDGSPATLAELRGNILKAGIVGTLVANDFRSCMVVVPLQEVSVDSGQPIDYQSLSNMLEEKIRPLGTGDIRVHIVGFAKLVGDLIDGLHQVMGFFAISALLAGIIIFIYMRCIRSTLLLLCLSSLSVMWMLGIVQLLGHVLDPYSILVPFLIFAISASHGAQKMNGILQDVGRGTDKYVAARYTFRRLFMAGLTALLTNMVGFSVLMVIDIPVFRELALTTSIGVTVLIFTILILVPVCLSYIGVSPKAAKRFLEIENRPPNERKKGINLLPLFTRRKPALAALLTAAVVWGGAYTVSTHVKTGDLDPGAPELRPDSRYNKDVAYINAHYGLSSDQFAVIVKTPEGGINSFETLTEMDRLEQILKQLPGVQITTSAADFIRFTTAGLNDGSFKWLSITRGKNLLGDAGGPVITYHPEAVNSDQTVGPVIAYLSDHRAETLDRVLDATEKFGNEHNTPERQFLPAAGSAGIAAITNLVVRAANFKMLLFLYGALVVLCFLAFRSWRAVIVALVPLLLTSTFCEALMVFLGIGIKVETLPVIALGVGVGVDYALYILSVQLRLQRKGVALEAAYAGALAFTGKVVALVGFTMAAGVVSWIFSPIKFQANMGILLAFMFIWNMIGTLILIPALSHFLLQSRPVDQNNLGAVAASI